MEHLIFTFHTQTFNFLLYGLANIADDVFSTHMVTNLALLAFTVQASGTYTERLELKPL